MHTRPLRSSTGELTDQINWRPGAIELDVSLGDRPPAVTLLALPGEAGRAATETALPLAEVRLAGEGNDIASSERLMGGGLSRRMRYLSHQEHERADGARELEVAMRDPETSLTVITTLTAW